MEHRWSKRQNITLPVLVFEHKLPVATGYCTNVSASGIYLCTGHTKWNVNSILEIELHDEFGHVRLPGMIVHRSPKGFGMMLSELQPTSRTILNRIIQSHNKPQLSCRIS